MAMAVDTPVDTDVRKRVLMLAPLFPPSVAAGTFRTLRFVKYLDEFGWEPLVVTLDPSNSGRAVDRRLETELPESLVVERTAVRYLDDVLTKCFHGVKRLLHPAQANGFGPRLNGDGGGTERVPGKPTRLGRLLRNARDLVLVTPDKEIAWKRPAYRAARRLIQDFSPHAIYSTGPPHSVHMIAAKLKRKTGLPWVADFRDPWARRPWGPSPDNPWGQEFFQRFEETCVTRADAVVLNTEALRRDFLLHYPSEPSGKFEVITNGFDPACRERVDLMRSDRVTHGPDTAIRIFHAGAFYLRRDPRPFLRALAMLIRQGYKVVFEHMGHSEPKWELEALARQEGLENHVVLHPHDKHDVVLERMREANLLLILQPDTHLQVPSKLFEMLLFRRPILALADDEGETAQIIRRFGLGAVANPRMPNAIADAILAAANLHPLDLENWQHALNTFDGRKLTRDLADCLDRITGGRRATSEPSMFHVHVGTGS